MVQNTGDSRVLSFKLLDELSDAVNQRRLVFRITRVLKLMFEIGDEFVYVLLYELIFLIELVYLRTKSL